MPKKRVVRNNRLLSCQLKACTRIIPCRSETSKQRNHESNNKNMKREHSIYVASFSILWYRERRKDHIRKRGIVFSPGPIAACDSLSRYL